MINTLSAITFQSCTNVLKNTRRQTSIPLRQGLSVSPACSQVSLQSQAIFSILLSSTTWLLCRERKQFCMRKPWRVLLSLMCSVSYLSLQRTILLAPDLGTYSPLHGKGPLARKGLVVSQQVQSASLVFRTNENQTSYRFIPICDLMFQQFCIYHLFFSQEIVSIPGLNCYSSTQFYSEPNLRELLWISVKEPN